MSTKAQSLPYKKFSFDEAADAAAEVAMVFHLIGRFVEYGYEASFDDFDLLKQRFKDGHYAGLIGSLADYAWRGVRAPEGVHMNDWLSEANLMADNLRGNVEDPGGRLSASARAIHIVKQVTEAASARYFLGDEVGNVTLSALAALAGISEKTIRASTNPKHPNPIKIEKNGHWTLVNANDAYAWLDRRGDFIFNGEENYKRDSVQNLDELSKRLAELPPEAINNELDDNFQTAISLLIQRDYKTTLVNFSPVAFAKLADLIGVADKASFVRTLYPELFKNIGIQNAAEFH